MKNIVRALSIAVLLVFVCVMMAGCHGSRALQAFEMPESFDTSKQIEISFWAKNDTNITQTRIYERAIEEFEALYPNVTVKVKLYTDYGRIYNDVITNISTNTTPNVCITYPDHIATYKTGSNCVVDLTELARDPAYGLGGTEVAFDAPTVDEIVPKFLNECTIGGRLYALPFMRSTEALYINRDYVEALGYEIPEVVTWDFIWEVSEAAMEKDEDGNFLLNGQQVLIPFIYKSTDNMMIQMLRQQGAGYSTEDGEVLLFNDTTADILRTVYEHSESRAFSTFKISSYPANFLNAGQCIFAIDSTAGATWMGSDAPLVDIPEDKLAHFETVVKPLPVFEEGQTAMISQGPSVCVFNKEDPQEVLASWLFVQYLLTNDIQIAYSQTEGYAPVTLKAQQSEEYQDYLSRSGEDNELYYSVKLDATRILLDNMDNTFVTPVFNGSASLRNAAGQLIEKTVTAARRSEGITDESIAALYADTEALYRLDQLGDDAEELGPLPGTAKWLIAVLAAVWAMIASYVVYGAIKKNKLSRRV